MKKLLVIFAAVFATTFAQAETEDVTAGAWVCAMEQTELKGASVSILLSVREYTGQAEVVCVHPFEGVVTDTVDVIYKAVGFGAGFSIPKRMYVASLNAGIKVDDPANMYGKYKLGLGSSATVIAVEGGFQVSLMDPDKGLVLGLDFFLGHSIGLEWVPVKVQSITLAEEGTIAKMKEEKRKAAQKRQEDRENFGGR